MCNYRGDGPQLLATQFPQMAQFSLCCHVWLETKMCDQKRLIYGSSVLKRLVFHIKQTTHAVQKNIDKAASPHLLLLKLLQVLLLLLELLVEFRQLLLQRGAAALQLLDLILQSGLVDPVGSQLFLSPFQLLL